MTKKTNRIIITCLVLLFNLFILMFPRDMVAAARHGINLWLSSVFPALFPFVFGVNMLMGTGVVGYAGRKLTPVMTRLFGVPGAGGFAMIVGFTSGYPIGAKVVSELRLRGEVSKTQAERLISFCNNSGPLFILGTVGASIFANLQLGYFILSTHYGAALVTGLLFKYYKYDRREHFASRHQPTHQMEALTFGDSVIRGVQTMLAIGGFITLFSVVIEIIKISGLQAMVYHLFGQIVASGLLGIIEVTNGTKYLADISGGVMGRPTAVTIASIISFAGLSIHAQSLSFISKTDINPQVYFLGKLVHAGITLLLGIGLYPLFF